jgi:hypothetical protein
MNVRLPNGTVIKNVPEGTTQEELMRRLKLAEQTAAPIEDPLTAETNKAALEAIGEVIPSSIKEAASTVGEGIQAGWKALPEPVKAPLRSTGNFMLDALDILNRPFQAVATASKQFGQELKPEIKAGAGSEIPALFRAVTKEGAAGRIASAAKRGFMGEERASAQELLSDEFRKANPVTSAVIGFGGDVIIDPLKASVVSMPFKATKEAISAIPGATSIATRLTDNELFRAINITTGDVDKTRELYNNYRYLRDKAKFEGVQDAKRLNNEIKVLSKQSNIPADELKAKIVHDIETGQLSNGQIGQIEQNIINRNRELLDAQRAAGVDIGDLGQNYMPHVISKEVDDILTKADRKNFYGTRPSAKNPNAISRELDGTIAEINAKNIYGTDKFFIDDPAILLGTSEFRAANAIAGQKFINDIQALGVKADTAPSNYVTIPEVPGVKFAPEVANLANRSYRLLTNTEEMNKFFKVYDGAQNWWKMWSLGIRPAYHAKNVVGNVWNAYLGGLTNPKTYGDAALFQTKLAQNKLTGNIAGKPAKELYEEMSKRGVFGEGQYGGGEFSRVLERELAPIKATDFITPSTKNAFLRAGFKTGQTLEDNARIALFLDQVKKGKTYDQAGKHVQKYLFDYGDVSPFEQSTLKRVMPFYTWSRKNIPLQLEAIVTHPDKLSKLGLGINNIQQAAGMESIPDPSQVPEYLVERAPVYVGKDPNTAVVSAVTLENLMPFFDLGPFTRFLNAPTVPKALLESGPQGIIDSFLGNASPLIKAPLEYLTNYDTFKKREIKEFEGQTADMFGIQVPVHTAKLLSNIVVLNELDRLNPGGIFGVRSRDAATGEITPTPSIFGTTRESRIDLPEEQRQMQSLTGVRVFDINMDEAEYNRMKKITGEINKLKGKLSNAAKSEKDRYFYQAEEALNNYLNSWDKLEAEIEARKARR